MVELKVLEHISRQLSDYTTNFFALWNEADPVYNHLIGADSFAKENYLKSERRKFFDALLASPSYELPIAVDTTLDRLSRFWTDSKEFMEANKDGIGTEPVAWSLIKIYYHETCAYASELYYYSLIRPDLTPVDLSNALPGLDKKWVRDYLIGKGFITAAKLDQLERPQKDAPDPHSQPGKAMKTRKNDASANWDTTIEKVCNLLNGDLVKYDNNQIHWVFKGNAAQYAYFALKLKIATGDTDIRWEYLKDQVIFATYSAQYKLLRKNASIYAKQLEQNQTKGLPQGYTKIDKAFR